MVRLNRNRSPQERFDATAFESAGCDFTASFGLALFLGKKKHSDGEISFGSLSEPLCFAKEKSSGKLNEKSGAVTGAPVGVDCSAMGKIAERFECVFNYPVAWLP